MSATLVFLDIETTGLDPRKDEVWEFAAIRRETDGTETRHHHFVEHQAWRRNHLPESFRADLEARFDSKTALAPYPFGDLLRYVLRGKPRIVGAAPWFDAAFLAEYIDPCWSHRLVDVETLLAGKVGRLVNGLSDAAAILGLDHSAAHTALGDAEMARAVFDAVLGRDA